jgi:hypothetical protein
VGKSVRKSPLKCGGELVEAQPIGHLDLDSGGAAQLKASLLCIATKKHA